MVTGRKNGRLRQRERERQGDRAHRLEQSNRTILFADGMIKHVENPKESTEKKLLDIINSNVSILNPKMLGQFMKSNYI